MSTEISLCNILNWPNPTSFDKLLFTILFLKISQKKESRIKSYIDEAKIAP